MDRGPIDFVENLGNWIDIMTLPLDLHNVI